MFKANSGTKGYAADINQAIIAGYNGTISGVATTPGTGLAVDVSAGTVAFQQNEVAVAGGTVSLDAADPSYGRLDLIVHNGTILTKITGAPSSEPNHANYTLEDYVVLAMVYVAANATSLAGGDVTDYRNIYLSVKGGINKFVQTFVAQTSVTVNHNLGDSDVVVQVYDSSGETIIPENTDRTTSNQVMLTFSVATTGTVMVVGGEFSKNASNGIAKYAEVFTSQTSIVVVHNLGDTTPLVQVYDDVSNLIEPDSVVIDTNNQVTVNFSIATTGKVVVQGGSFSGVSGGLPVSTEHGSIVFDNGSGYTLLTPGTDGQVLITRGTGVNPEWSDIDGGTL